MPGFGEFLKNHRNELVMGATTAMVAGSVAMVFKGEKKRAEDFASDGLMETTKGDTHPIPATTLLIDEVSGAGSQRSDVGSRIS